MVCGLPGGKTGPASRTRAGALPRAEPESEPEPEPEPLMIQIGNLVASIDVPPQPWSFLFTRGESFRCTNSLRRTVPVHLGTVGLFRGRASCRRRADSVPEVLDTAAKSRPAEDAHVLQVTRPFAKVVMAATELATVMAQLAPEQQALWRPKIPRSCGTKRVMASHNTSSEALALALVPNSAKRGC